MRAAGALGGPTTTLVTGRGGTRRLSVLGALALVLGALATLTGATPARAAQATGDDVPTWAPGWSWTYGGTSFRYQADGTDVTINESVTYTVAGVETFQGQEAYRLDISGTISGGSGSVAVDGLGNASLSSFSGTVSGTRFVRVSDLALLRESQNQHLNARASLSLLSANITADIGLTMDPQRGWRTHVFPLNAGDSWQLDEQIEYTGGFSYDAGSIGGSGSSTFEGVLPFQATAGVTTATINPGIGNVAADRVHAQTADGSTVNTHWWAPSVANDAQELLQLPLDGARLTLERKLTASSRPSPSPTIVDANVTSSLTCAGGTVQVTGRLSTGASGVPVQVRLDKSPVQPGQQVTATATTTTGGGFTATLQAPSDTDGAGRNGARASWGVKISAGGATAVRTLVVTPRNCTTLEYTGATGAPQGTDAIVAARLTDLAGDSVAGRTITFSLAGGGSVDATTNASGVATVTLPVNGPPRTSTVTATFAGNAGQESATASASFAVGKIGTTTTVVAEPAVVTVGDDTVFTATVTPDHGGAVDGGTVQFKVDGQDFGAPQPVSGGTATSPPYSGDVGFHEVVAVFSGTGDHAASGSGAFTFRIRVPLLPTSATSGVAPGSTVYGQEVTLVADVSSADGDATGTVTFTSAAGTLATAGVDASGHAEAVVDDIPVGAHQVTATYSGDDKYAGSSAPPTNLVVAKADVDVQLTSSDTTTVTGEAVSFTATVGVRAPGGGSPDGSVQLRVDGVDVGGPVDLTGGTAVFPPVTSLGAGTHTVAAVYSGSGSYVAGQASLTQVVEKADTAVAALATPSPAVQDTAATLTARVTAVAPGSGAPTGTVSFTANGEELGAAPLQAAAGGAEAAIDISDLAPGTWTITASYAGDGDYHGSTSETISHTVIAAAAVVPTTTALSSSQNPSTFGELVTFTATVTAEDGSTPSGVVQFSLDGTEFGAPVPVDADGVAESDTLASPEPGDHTVIATFRPDTGWSGSGDLLTQTVEAAPVDVALVSSAGNADYGQTVRFTATVSSQAVGAGTPSGHVQFVLDGQPLGDAVELDGDGKALSPPVSDLVPGDHEVRALYSGSASFRSAARSITQSVAKVATATALSVTPTSVSYGQTVSLRATVTAASGGAGSPLGTVTFKRGGTTIATVPVTAGEGPSATATATVDDLGAGSHTITAEYSGTPVFAASSSAAATVSVGKQATVLKADAALVNLIPLGLPVGLLKVRLTSAAGAPVVGAPIEFRIGNSLICTSTTDAKGVAECNARSYLLQLTLALGYKAAFAGDADRLASSANGAIVK